MLGLGVSLVIVGWSRWRVRSASSPASPACRRRPVDRVVPASVTYRMIVPGLKLDYSVFVVGGLMVVLGSSWVIVYNAER